MFEATGHLTLAVRTAAAPGFFPSPGHHVLTADFTRPLRLPFTPFPGLRLRIERGVLPPVAWIGWDEPRQRFEVGLETIAREAPERTVGDVFRRMRDELTADGWAQTGASNGPGQPSGRTDPG